MKHSAKITLVLLSFFLAAQFIGIAILYNYIDTAQSQEQGKTTFKELPILERPQLAEQTAYIPLIIAIIFGTFLMLFIMKKRIVWLWRLWFLSAVVISLSVALAVFIPAIIAFIIALGAGLWKLLKPNFWIQNFTELFIYGGLAAIFVPILNLFSVSVLMILIAIYDAYAVWKSKHMITLAKEQSKAKMFAGLLIPYKLGKKTPQGKKKKLVKVKTAILGGGDIGFPLIFAGVLLKEWGLWQALIIPFFALAGLTFLLFISKKDRFYPAMPFIGAGCFLGLGVVWVIQSIL